MKIAFVCAPVSGHLNPMTALARKLKSRGHDVIFISTPDAESIVQAAEIPFSSYCAGEFPPGSSAEGLRELGRLQGDEALALSIRLVSSGLEASFQHLPTSIRENSVDAVVLDDALTYLGLIPMQMGLPYVHISLALHGDMSGHTPFRAYDWFYERTPEAFERNHEGLRTYEKVSEPRRAVGRGFAERGEMNIDWSDPYATVSKLAWLTQVPKEFDFPNPHWPPQFHHTGPLHDGLSRRAVEFPWTRLTGEPIVYASMGTLQNGLESVFSTIAESVGTHRGVQLVMSIGPAIDATRVCSLPSNAVVVSEAPQIELLKRSILCITHAGLNTVLESLAQGVPMVAIPVTIDQPGVAARIRYTQTGDFVPLKQLTAAKLSALIDQVLEKPEYRRNAKELQQAIVRTNGLEMAAVLIERAFRP
jgi:zeaxanthin glucosyltransferase